MDRPDDIVPRVSTDTTPDGTYSRLRHRALSVSRIELGIDERPSTAPVWGIMMESGYDDATMTLFALADGTTSIYFSNGGGVIGGHGHETVRNANVELLKEANQHLRLVQPRDAFPVPANDNTIFYLLTDSGVLAAAANTDDLGYGRHALSTLFHAAHEVITQLRLISEAAEGDS